MLLAGRVAFVTGAGSGIGRAIAELFTREGARVAGFDRSREAGAELVAALDALGAEQSLFVHGDVRVSADVERAIDDVVTRAGRIDAVVNCAGVREIGDVYTLSTDEWDNVLAVNLSGVFYCCQSAARRMRETGGGSITNISSVGGLIGLSHRPAYTAAKHGVIGLTKSLARDLAPDGIRVNAICPGLIRTPLTESYFADEAFERGLATIVPQQRVGVAADVANAALYLASDMASYVNGIALTVDGGWLAEKSFVAGDATGSTFLASHDTDEGAP
jgi:NAD(P)-dependent dehydrogenase (short-subunit alcohol dehydrogenase family)